MSGSNIKFLKLSLRLLFIDIVFGLLPVILYKVPLVENIYYYIILIVMTIGCQIYTYRLLNINCQNNKNIRKILRKLNKNGFYKLDDCPIYSTYKSDGYGYFAKELYLTCIEEQRKLFEEKGYLIIVGSKEELKSFSKQRFINGYFSRVDKYILLFTDCETSAKKPYDIKIVTMTAFKRTFLHEWGHFVDFANDYISEKVEFYKYYKLVKNRYKYSVRFLCAGIPSLYFRKYPNIDLYELTTSSEFFASKYSEYRQGNRIDRFLTQIFDEVEEVQYANDDRKVKV